MQHNALEEELNKLPAPYGTILRMRYYDQCTYAEIAAAIGKSASNSRSLEGNALRRLRFTDSAKQLLSFYDFDYYHGSGFRRFKETGVSIQERYLINLEREIERQKPRYSGISNGTGFDLPDDSEQ